jgi:putative intracellular protease/amidase
MPRKILIALTSVDRYIKDDVQTPTGFYWEELAVPYWRFRDAGFVVTLASINGGEPPADPASADSPDPAVARFQGDPQAMQALAATRPIAEITGSFDAVFLPGGHGTMWDLRQSQALQRAIAATYDSGGVVGAVCHGPSGLLDVRLADGSPLVKGRRVNGFTDAEERASGLQDTVPFLLESELRRLGGLYESNPENFDPHAVRDDRLVTGQNPASSAAVADLMVEALEDRARNAA